jgi:glycosyltransferase involved in cell wall biosynthesis
MIHALPKLLLIVEGPGDGGSWGYCRNLLKSLDYQKFQVSIALRDQPSTRKAVEQDLQGLPIQNIYWVTQRSPNENKGFARALADLQKFLPIFFSLKPDLVHVSSVDPGEHLALIPFCKRSIITFHTYPLCPLRKSEKLLLKLIANFPKIREKFDFITVSKYAQKRLSEDLGLSVDDFQVIYNGIDQEKILSTAEASFISNYRADFLSKINASPDSKIVLSIGHVTSYKNPKAIFEVALRVWKQEPNVHFVWAGDGKLLAKMQLKAASEEFAGKIHFLGFRSDVKQLFAACDIYFHPSKLESFGYTLQEALLNGKPCVASNVGGIPEVLDYGRIGYLLDSNNYEGMASTIISVLRNPEQCASLKESGQQHALKFYTLEKHVSKMQNLYECSINFSG